MDHARFAALRRSLATVLSRRRVAGAAGVLAATGLSRPALTRPTSAAAKLKKQKKTCLATNKTCSQNRRATNACKRCCSRSFITQGNVRRCMCKAEGASCRRTSECCGATCAGGVCGLITEYTVPQIYGTPGSSDLGELDVPYGLGLAPNGDLYVSNNSPRPSAPNTIMQRFTRAGTAILGWGNFGPAPGDFDQPYAVAVTPNTTVYVADYLKQKVESFTAQGRKVALWDAAALTGGESEAFVQDLVANSKGKVVVEWRPSASDPFVIAQYTPNGQRPRLNWRVTPDSTPAATLSLAIGPQDVVYALPLEINPAIRRYAADGTALEPGIPLDSEGGVYYTLAVDRAGNIYTATASKVRKFAPDGAPLTEVQIPDPSSSTPEDLHVGPDGAVYVVDTGNNRILRFTPQ